MLRLTRQISVVSNKDYRFVKGVKKPMHPHGFFIGRIPNLWRLSIPIFRLALSQLSIAADIVKLK
jgi:hypothetical protein